MEITTFTTLAILALIFMENRAFAEESVGRRGYLHGGLGVIAPLNERQKIGIVSHFVREGTGGQIFPSHGAEFIQDLDGVRRGGRILSTR